MKLYENEYQMHFELQIYFDVLWFSKLNYVIV
jgi:hypothetical protein